MPYTLISAYISISTYKKSAMHNYTTIIDKNKLVNPGGSLADVRTQGGEPVGGLSILNKVCDSSNIDHLGERRTVLLRNFRTGEVIIQDPIITRIKRMQRRVITWAQITDALFTPEKGYITQMVTLTYRPGEVWQPNDIKNFEQKIRLQMKGHLVAYAWVGELQRRGAVHYHFILISDGKKVRHPDRSGAWKKGMSSVDTAKTKFYLVKYVGKEYQKKGVFPKNFRMYGLYANSNQLGRAGIYQLRKTTVPKWLDKQIENDYLQRAIVASLLPDGLACDPFEITWRRNTKGGGGWFLNGELVYSDWMYQGLGEWVGGDEPLPSDTS